MGVIFSEQYFRIDIRPKPVGLIFSWAQVLGLAWEEKPEPSECAFSVQSLVKSWLTSRWQAGSFLSVPVWACKLEPRKAQWLTSLTAQTVLRCTWGCLCPPYKQVHADFQGLVRPPEEGIHSLGAQPQLRLTGGHTLPLAPMPDTGFFPCSLGTDFSHIMSLSWRPIFPHTFKSL